MVVALEEMVAVVAWVAVAVAVLVVVTMLGG